MNVRLLRKLRVLGFIEGTSTLVLFGVAMPLKYLANMPMAVTIVGTLHGVLFLALVVACLIAMNRVPIGVKLGLAAIVGAVVPFGPFVVDRWLRNLESTGQPK